MVSSKVLCVAVALVAEVCASAGPSLLTLCVHEDGTVRYEPTMALCCKQNEQGHGECCSHDESSSPESRGITQDDACQDFSVALSQLPVPPLSVKQFLANGSALSELLPITAILPAVPLSEVSVSSGFCGPPPDHLLKDLSTVVLRI